VDLSDWIGLVGVGIGVIGGWSGVRIARRSQPRLHLSLGHGEHPAWVPPERAIVLTIQNSGQSTILRRGGVRYGDTINDWSWAFPGVTDVACPGGGLLWGSGPPVRAIIALIQMREITNDHVPLEIVIEDRAGNTASLTVPEEYRALFRRPSPVAVSPAGDP